MKTLVGRELEEYYVAEIKWMQDFQKKGSFESLTEHEQNCFKKMYHNACEGVTLILKLWDELKHTDEDRKKLGEISKILIELGEYKEEIFEPNED